MAYFKSPPISFESQLPEPAHSQAVERWALPHKEINGSLIATDPVSVGDYLRYARSIGRADVSQLAAMDQDQWICGLTRREAEAYCRWLGRIWGDRVEVRLPRLSELTTLGAYAGVWEWSSSSLAELDPDFQGGQHYEAAWQPDGPRFRRARDWEQEELAETCFRVAWESLR